MERRTHAVLRRTSWNAKCRRFGTPKSDAPQPLPEVRPLVMLPQAIPCGAGSPGSRVTAHAAWTQATVRVLGHRPSDGASKGFLLQTVRLIFCSSAQGV